MGDNSTYKSPQILMPENTNKDKVSNWSLDFDGVDDTIDIGTTSLGITTAISVSAWVKIPVTDTGGGGTNIRMITCEDAAGGADRNWLLYWRGTGYNYFMAGIFHTDGSSTTINSTGITPNDGNWHHVMLTFDGTTDANGLKLYVDGTLFQATAGSTGTRSTASVEPAIGSLTAGGGRFFQGNIDEVSVFDAVKVEADVSDGTEPIDVSGDSDLVAYWKLGEEARYNGTDWLVPNSALSNYSKWSFQFDGVDDYIDTGNTISFNYNDPFTISTWVKANAVSGYKTVYYKYDSSISGGRGIIIRLYSSSGSGINRVYFDLYSTNSGSTSTRKRITTDTGTIVDHDIWYLLTATYDGSGVGSGMKIYLNEVPQTVTVTQDNLQSGDITNSLNALIGATYTPSYVFNGNIDEVAIWDSVLSAGDVTAIYNSGEPTTITGAVAHWRMGEEATFSTNWTVPDQVGSNDGTSVNMTNDDLEGEAPNYSGSGTSDNMTIEDRVGEAPNSESNAVSYNMDAVDIESNVP